MKRIFALLLVLCLAFAVVACNIDEDDKKDESTVAKTEAQEALKACDLSNRDNFKSYVKHDLDVIFEEEPIVETSFKDTKKKFIHEVVTKKENE